MIQMPKKTHKRKTTTTQPTVPGTSLHMEGSTLYVAEWENGKEIPGTGKLAYETSTLSGREIRSTRYEDQNTNATHATEKCETKIA